MSEDEYRDPEAAVPGAPHSRREFIQRVGGGIVVVVTVAGSSEAQRRRGGRESPKDFNAYLRIGEDGRVTCFSGKIEMGQGIITSLAQMVADELDVALDAVDMVMGDTSVCPWDMGTFGSLTTRVFGPAIRTAAAEARGVLIELAAEHLNVPMERLTTADGTVLDKTQTADRVTYAELTKGKAILRQAKHKFSQKTAEEFRVMGTPVHRTDALGKVTGEAEYAGDIRLPGMLYARILRPPAHGARLKDLDVSALRKRDDVVLIEEEDIVAVLHERPDEAERALARVKAEFSAPDLDVDDESIFEYLREKAPRSKVRKQEGDIATGEGLAEITVEETYLNSYVAHAPMEPHTALAKIDAENATVWASTQTPFRLQTEVARVLDMPSEKVRIITPFVGGGFGGKTHNQQAVEAVRLAKLTGRPVQVAWTRAEEFFLDTFRPAAIVDIRSGVAKSGKIVFWDYCVYFAGERGADFFYDAPHHRTAVSGSAMRGGRPHPFAVGAWRAPANNTNTFARESHIDMMAAKANMDPIEFRLENLSDQRMAKVLEAAAEKAEWVSSPTPSGRGLGVACGMDAGTYVAVIAEAGVDGETGKVQVKRVVCAQDMGLVINPQGARIQVEGCVTMGLGYALSEEIHFKGGRILDRNFNTYELPRFSWLPKIETVLVEAGDVPPQGGGEPAIICVGAVVANAVHDACGARLFQLPMTPNRVKAAMTTMRSR